MGDSFFSREAKIPSAGLVTSSVFLRGDGPTLPARHPSGEAAPRPESWELPLALEPHFFCSAICKDCDYYRYAHELNTRPRKRHEYKTPSEIYHAS